MTVLHAGTLLPPTIVLLLLLSHFLLYLCTYFYLLFRIVEIMFRRILQGCMGSKHSIEFV